MPLRIAVPTAAATLLAIGLVAAPARAQPAPDIVGGLLASAVAGVVIGAILSDRADDAQEAAPEAMQHAHRRAHRRHGHGPGPITGRVTGTERTAMAAGTIPTGDRHAGGKAGTITSTTSSTESVASKSPRATATGAVATGIDQHPADLIEQDAETAGVRDAPAVFLSVVLHLAGRRPEDGETAFAHLPVGTTRLRRTGK